MKAREILAPQSMQFKYRPVSHRQLISANNSQRDNWIKLVSTESAQFDVNRSFHFYELAIG